MVGVPEEVAALGGEGGLVGGGMAVGFGVGRDAGEIGRLDVPYRDIRPLCPWTEADRRISLSPSWWL